MRKVGLIMAIRNPFTNKEQSETATILVVDDEVPVRTMMAKMLQRSGYTTLEAPGGKEALEICEQHIGIHLLITDLTMPGLNGFVGESLVFLGMFDVRPALAVAGTAGIVLGAWYLLTMLRRVFFGPVKEPIQHGDEPVGDLNLRELAANQP